MGTVIAILLIVLVVAVMVVVAVSSVKVVPEAQVRVIERFGRFDRVMQPGLHMIMPLIERTRAVVDMRVRPVNIEKQRVITRDDLMVDIDSVVYLQVIDPKAATYQVSSYLKAVEKLIVTNLRNFVGEMEFDAVLNSRDDINKALRGVLDDATGGWGLRVSRVELREILPSEELQEVLQKQARAERDRRAMILEARGASDSEAIKAGGRATYIKRVTEAQAERTVMIADADAEAKRKVAQGQADAIAMVFDAIHKGHPDQQLLAYEYLRTLPEIAQGDANKMWFLPSELGHALEGIGSYFGSHEADAGHLSQGAGDSGEAGDGSTGPAADGIPSRNSGEPGKVRLVPPDAAAVPGPRQSR